MNQLAKNFLWHFRYYLPVLALIIGVFLFVMVKHRISARALQLAAARQAEQDALVQKENARMVDEQVERAKVELGESNRLFRIQQVKLQKQESEKKLSDLKAYKARYIESHVDHHSIAVLVANETGHLNAPVNYALLVLLNTNGITATASLFTPDFITDGLFGSVLTGSREPMDKLELTNFTHAVLLARQSVRYSTNSELDGLITATMRMDVNTFSTKAFELIFADSMQAEGAGLSCLEARNMAEERILKRIKGGSLANMEKAIMTQFH